MQHICIARYVLWLGVCPSVRHTLVSYRIETDKRIGLVFGRGYPRLIYPTLCYKLIADVNYSNLQLVYGFNSLYSL